jgi:23S rRNA pseudouridine2605 synthase
MTINNEESQPKQNFRSKGDGKHVSFNKSYTNDKNMQSENRNANETGRYYRQPYNESQQKMGEDAPSGENVKKRRPRIGERAAQPSYNRNYNGGGQQGQYGERGYSRTNPAFNNSANPNQKKFVKPKKKKKLFKQIKYKENVDPNAPIRLNKYLANAGVCSRREADEFIQAGVVKVNGQVITELGTKITRADEVTFHDQPVKLESKVYVLLNKPKGFVTTTDDPENRKTVMELVKSACSERIYPVGRLDRSTTGVLLLTNDGDLASKLTHPKYEKRKIYQVWLDKPVTAEHMQMIADGIELEDGEIHADAISYVSEDDLSQVGIEIHSGKNRVVRRIFEKLGYKVLKLDRVYFAGLTKKNLPRGKWRYLSEQEVNMLRMGNFD